MTEEEKRERRRQARIRRQRQVRRRKILLAVILSVVVIAAAAGVTARFSGSAGNGAGTQTADVSGTAVSSDAAGETGDAGAGQSADASAADSIAEAVTEEVSITLSFTGDCTLGTDETFGYSGLPGYYESYGADYFFDGVRDVFEADDITVINMEGTFTTETTRADKTYAFKADPEYVSILTGSSVEAANLANNHSHDYGTQSYTDTIDTLEDSGISHFGYEDIAYIETQGVTVALIGIYELAEGLGVSDQVSENIQTAQEAGADVIVVCFHWGTEKESCPESNQVELAHLAIDEGADLVVGHHPHVLQGIEYYNGKTIAYSLGNFCFGGNRNPSDKDTMILQMTFTLEVTAGGANAADDGTSDESSADSSAGSTAEITDTQMNVIPCSLSSTSDYNDYQPTILSGDSAQSVLDKIASRSQEIASNYDVQGVYEGE